jgi:hypothetical protein
VPLWVECDGILDTAPLTLKFREIVGTGTTTIGINMRTADDIPQDMLEHVNVKTYRDKTSDSCILEATASKENII